MVHWADYIKQGDEHADALIQTKKEDRKARSAKVLVFRHCVINSFVDNYHLLETNISCWRQLTKLQQQRMCIKPTQYLVSKDK